jgi:UTP-glucose-1-phosphate uridylyltransferase
MGAVGFPGIGLSILTMANKTLLVLAAGMGSRYGGLKQMVAVGPNGATIIDYSVYDALRAGFDQLVFIIRKGMEDAFREIVGSRYEQKTEVRYVFQELGSAPLGIPVNFERKKPWGTGHAILAAAEVVRQPFAVINADDFYGRESFQAVAEHLSPGNPDYGMVGFRLRNTLSEFGTVARGVCRLTEDGCLKDVTEITTIGKIGKVIQYRDDTGMLQRLTGEEIVSMNMWGFQPTIFDHLREQFAAFLRLHGLEEKSEFYIPMVVNKLVQDGASRVRVLPTPAAWHGVTYREDLPLVATGIRKLIANGTYPNDLWLPN